MDDKVEMRLKTFRKVDGVLKRRGDKVFVTPGEAEKLRRRGYAVDVAPPPVVEVKPKRKYTRRDMTAESTTALTADEPLNAWAYPKTPSIPVPDEDGQE